jgi:hypothetical protein
MAVRTTPPDSIEMRPAAAKARTGKPTAATLATTSANASKLLMRTARRLTREIKETSLVLRTIMPSAIANECHSKRALDLLRRAGAILSAFFSFWERPGRSPIDAYIIFPRQTRSIRRNRESWIADFIYDARANAELELHSSTAAGVLSTAAAVLAMTKAVSSRVSIAGEVNVHPDCFAPRRALS